MAQSVPTAVIGASADGAVLTSETMIAKALSILSAFTIDTAHGACIPAAVGPNKTLVTGADAVVAVSVARAH